MESDGDHLQQQQHAEAAEEAMAMAANAGTAATSAAGAAENRDKGKTIWIPDEGPSNPTDDLLLDIDGDDLIFSDAAFSCLPDFPCLPSPAGSPSSSSACNPFHNTSLASSSSSSSSFLFAPDGGGSGGGDLQAVASSSNGERMMPSEVASDLLSMELEGLDILGDMGLFDLSEQWDPASLFPDNMTVNGAATASTSGPGPSPSLHAMAGEARPPGEAGVGGGVATGAPRVGPAEDPEEMARVFFEWMRINRDAISPQDLREIRMKRATIDCAVRHLGGNRQAQVQLLKLVLTWVQANHLLKKKRRRIPNEQQDRSEGAAQPQYPYHHQQQQQQQQPFAPPNHHVPIMSSDVPVNPNPNLDYSYAADSQRNGWIPYHVDPTTGAAFPVMMPVYGGSTSGGEPAYPGPAATNYSYHRGSTSGIVLNGRPFSPSPDMHAADHTPAAWPSQYSAAPAQYVPFPGAAGPHPAPMPQAQYPRGFVNQYPGHALYQQGQQLGGMASATKEARKKRMARQRRASSLHSHRSQQQQQQNHHQAESSSSRAPAEGAISSSSSNANNNNSNNDNNNRSRSFWSSTSSSRQKNPMMEAPPPPKSSMQQPQLSPSMPPKQQQQQQQQQQNSHRDAASAADRRQGLKGEKNLRFLFQKVLKQSDVGSLGRIVLPKKEAEIHLPELETRDGMSIPMEDIGTSQIWNMRYRFWPNNKSRMYLLENTGEFVRSNGLQEGDFIVIYSDMKCGKYMIRGVKVPQQPERGQANRSVARSHLKRSSWERGSTTRMRGSSSHDGINDDPGMPSSSAASPFMIKMEASP